MLIEVGTTEELKNVVQQYPGVVLDIVDQVPVLTMEGFRLPGIRAGFSTRLGGVSSGIYASLNLALRIGDDETDVLTNYERFGNALGVDHRRISCPDQVHKTRILVAGETDAGDGILRDKTHQEIDAQITDVKELPLIVFAADCVPILFADPVHHVVGSAHAGWRGSVAGIAAKTVKKMQEVYGSEPADILVMIGPSAGPEGYEVDETVAREVRTCGIREEEVLLPSERPGHSYLNLWELNRQLLCGAGVSHEHIHIMGISTLQYPQFFFSHRRTEGKRGLNAGIISIG